MDTFLLGCSERVGGGWVCTVRTRGFLPGAQGKVIKGEAGIKRSRYQEDVLINNHTSVRTLPLSPPVSPAMMPLCPASTLPMSVINGIKPAGVKSARNDAAEQLMVRACPRHGF